MDQVKQGLSQFNVPPEKRIFCIFFRIICMIKIHQVIKNPNHSCYEQILNHCRPYFSFIKDDKLLEFHFFHKA